MTPNNTKRSVGGQHQQRPALILIAGGRTLRSIGFGITVISQSPINVLRRTHSERQWLENMMSTGLHQVRQLRI